MYFLAGFLALLLACVAVPVDRLDKCGYDSCELGREDMLNVHLIPHTHDDVGWLKTVDQYYYGSETHYQRAGVQYILDSVVQALAADPERKFTYVEMAFFMRWWRQQTDKTKAIVKQLVQSGQLQFVLGGWSMADEATVHYGDAIDQMTLGHDRLRQLFGECGLPRVAWQIDPFGHSRDHTELFRDSGMDAVFFQRMDHREKLARREKKLLEVMWDTRASENDTGPGLFTSMFYDSYCYPATFCFDDKCGDQPIQDDPELEDYNVEERVAQFLSYINQVKNAFATNHIMVLMGCDFTYENANANFKNMDKLIKYVNKLQKSENSKVNLFYSTPACYTKAVNQAFKSKQTIATRSGDFFPYASGNHSYWTGFYTSRASLKNYVRQASNLLGVCEQINAYANRIHKLPERNPISEDNLVDKLRQVMGVLQHHDAVSGTEKQHVARDYALRLSKASQACHTVVADGIIKLVPDLNELGGGQKPQFCDLLNISVCQATDGGKPYLTRSGEGGIYIVAYNPTGWPIKNVWTRIPLYLPKEDTEITFRVLDLHTDRALPFQLSTIDQRVLDIPERIVEEPLSDMELIVNLADNRSSLNPAGVKTYYLALRKDSHTLNDENSNAIPQNLSCDTLNRVTDTMDYSLELNADENIVYIVADHLETGSIVKIAVEMLYYYGESEKYQYSGAYVFRPKIDDIVQTFNSTVVTRKQGPLVDELNVQYAPWASMTVRVYCNAELEVEWTVGPIPDDYPQKTREVIIRYTVDGDAIKPKLEGEFFTDSAGRRLIRRVRDQRVDWNLDYNFTETEPVAGNYYPIVNRIMLRGNNPLCEDAPTIGFVVYTDRAQGGTSLEDGQVEIMLHRRTAKDDGYGVGEPLRENGVDGQGLIVRGVHRLRLDELSIIDKEDFMYSTLTTRKPLLTFVPAVKRPYLSAEWSFLTRPLPQHIHLLNFGSWPMYKTETERDQLLVRFEHSPNGVSASEPEEMDITNLFRGIRIFGAQEMTLTADQDLESAQARRLQWPVDLETPERKTSVQLSKENSVKVILELTPGTISTYVLDYKVLGEHD
ncbi:hypothetical protein EG68_08829 [Paragonimus skrjabini miyazakii]|uniref:Alpha-mannosidase n=2 Tax=Paragonimus skrjabini miyazakii TaxID=59628 RepID=A0A8S9YJ68_9TREM|nr:hypothetical protein EG68_08829 [Paragonimus skrjabini miyazakii]